ncbi:transmembrane protein 242-like [Asterias amurensis]|uniref:transmembrane protein 242-like n=1 Tax=Asterias amurensis TaxID=7602 RepID=UPI003AB4BE3D
MMDTVKFSEQQQDDDHKDSSGGRFPLFKGSVFMVGIAGIAMLSGFGMTIAGSKRKHPASFTKGIFPDPSASLHESGASLGLRALLWGSFFAVTGFGTMTFLVCKAMGVKSVADFQTKFQSVAPRIRRNEASEPEEVTLNKLREEIFKDEIKES